MTRKLPFRAIVFALLFVLISAAFPLRSQAASNGWNFITVTPESGNWNRPGHFILVASRDVTVSWVVKCTFGGCDRPDETVNNFKFTAGQTVTVGWGHQCYAWQFDRVGSLGYIADAETNLCAPAQTPTLPATAVPPTGTPTPTSPTPPTGTTVPPTATPTTAPTTPVVPPGTTTATPAPTGTTTVAAVTATAIVATPTFTPPAPTEPAQPQATEVIALPVTGQAPPASPLASPLWPALAALVLLALSGRLVWTGVLQAENVQLPGNPFPAMRSQARKALILIGLSLVILATLVLPSIIRQAALDYGEPSSDSPQLPAILQAAPRNPSLAPVVQQPAMRLQSGLPALEQQLPENPQPLSPVNNHPPVLAPAGVNQAVSLVDASPVTRLVIPALKVDAKVQYVPFENQTWNIEKLGMDIAWLGDTSSPGLGGNTVLAGHITLLYLGNGPFRYLYTLKPGDQVQVYTDSNIYTYSVQEQAVVKPNDPSVIGPSDHSQLTLLTCTGWDKDTLQYTKRRAVFANLVSTTPISDQKTDGLPVEQ